MTLRSGVSGILQESISAHPIVRNSGVMYSILALIICSPAYYSAKDLQKAIKIPALTLMPKSSQQDGIKVPLNPFY